MTELTLLISDATTGRVVVDVDNPIGRAVASDLTTAGMGPGTPVGCARPDRGAVLRPVGRHAPGTGYTQARIAGVWHDSFIEGPGRRSVVQFQGCPIQCKGCWVPETWDAQGGYLIDVPSLRDALLDPAHDRDGVTILGGEPFAQPLALDMLVYALRIMQPGLHIVVYTGYTLARLRRMARLEPVNRSVRNVLESIDLLIDGPYVQGQATSAGPWTGSGNQRVIDLQQ